MYFDGAKYTTGTFWHTSNYSNIRTKVIGTDRCGDVSAMPHTWEAEAEGLPHLRNQSGLHGRALGQPAPTLTENERNEKW